MVQKIMLYGMFSSDGLSENYSVNKNIFSKVKKYSCLRHKPERRF